MQPALFDDEPLALMPGARLDGAFLSAAEEATLLDAIRALPLAEAKYKEYTARRRVASFGGKFDYDTNELRDAPPIPTAFEPLRAKVAAHLGVEPERFQHMLIAEYRLGTPLGWHRDVPQFESIVGLSLHGAARMRFRPYPPAPGRAKEIVQLDLAPRSLYVLEGPARWDWQHSVVETPGLRYSITLRTLRGSKRLLPRD